MENSTAISTLKKRVTFAFLCVGFFAVTGGLVYLGWWRVQSMIFSASVKGGPLDRFMTENAGVTRLAVIFLTLGLPVAAAIIYSWASAKLHDWWHRSKIRCAALKYPRKYENSRRKLEMLEEKRDRKLAGLSEQEKEWINAYLQNYALGQRIGPQKLPFKYVVIKTAAVTVGVAAGCAVVNLVLKEYVPGFETRMTLYVLSLLFAGMAAFAYFYKAWDRPTPAQLFKQRAVMWAGTAPTQAARPNWPPSGPVPPIPQVAESRTITLVSKNGGGHE